MIRHRPRSSYCKAISVREARTTSRIVPVCTAISCNFVSSFCLGCSGCHRLRNFANSLTTFQLLHLPFHANRAQKESRPPHKKSTQRRRTPTPNALPPPPAPNQRPPRCTGCSGTKRSDAECVACAGVAGDGDGDGGRDLWGGGGVLEGGVG